MKKVFLSLLIALCTVCALFGFAACDDTNGSNGSGAGTGTEQPNTPPKDQDPAPQSYSITVDCGEGGSYRLSHESPVAAGTQVTLTVTTNTGYSLSSITKNGEAVNLVNGRHVFTPTADTAFVITFEKLYTVSVECGANGNYTLSPENLFYRKNAEVTLFLLPNTGYEVDAVTVNGTAVSVQNNQYTFNVTANTEIAVTFKALVSVTVTCGSGGNYELSPTGGIYSAGTAVTLTLLPNAGYEVDSVTVNGTAAEIENNQYTFNVTADTEISVTFKALVSVTVTCGSGGSYELSPAGGIYSEGTPVTLTLLPNDGYEVQSLTVNGTDRTEELAENVYSFTVTGNTTIVVRYYLPADETALDVLVTSSGNGSYKLSPEAPYHAGDDVVLTLTPESGYHIGSVEVNGQDVTAQLENNAYTIHLTDDVNVEIVFAEDLFGPDYIGTWTSIVSSGTLPNELVIGANTFTFNETAYTPTKTATGYTFTVTEDQDVYTYSFTLEEVGEGKYLLVLTIGLPDASTLTQNCTKEGVDYSVTFPEELWGDWESDTVASSLSIMANALTIGDDEAVVFGYDEATKTYRLFAGSTEYTLVWDEAKGTLTLATVDGSRPAVVYGKNGGVEERFFTEYAGNRYTNGAHTVIIEENGAFNYDGKIYHVFPIDSSAPKGACYFITSSGRLQLMVSEYSVSIFDYRDIDLTLKRVTGEEAYSVTVTCGDNGTYELSSPASGKETYAAYEKVTLTIRPAEGYKLHLFTFDGKDITATITENVYEFYISKNVTVAIEFVSEGVVENLIPDLFAGNTYTGVSDQGYQITLVFEANRVTVTINTQEFVLEKEDITVTNAMPEEFTFTATLGDYGEVTFESLLFKVGSGRVRGFYLHNASGTLTANVTKS